MGFTFILTQPLFMELVSLLLLLVIVFLIFSFKDALKTKLDKIEHQLYQLKNDIDKIQQQKTDLQIPQKQEEKTITQQQTSITPSSQKTKQEKDYWQTGFVVEEEKTSTNKPATIVHTQQQTPLHETVKFEDEFIAQHSFFKSKKKDFVVEKKPDFFERNPDLEKFIGENLVSKIGIAILVIGIGIFVKYAIDKQWIGEIGRVSIGILCGTILVALAHYLRKNYKAFSSVLVGGGLAVYYFTIMLAYQQFKLMPQTAAFIIMIVITTFAVIISLLYNRQELAIIALTGGFLAPFLVSNGSENFVTLFTYLIVLNSGLLIIAYNKSWRLLNLLSFIFTHIIFLGWLFTVEHAKKTVYEKAFLFGSIFYVLFFAINVAHNIKEQTKFIASDFGILLANTAIYFGIGLYCLQHFSTNNYNGIFSAALGLFNLIATYTLFKSSKIDKNILYLLIGITLTFISLIAPLQLHGNYITLFWASEAVLIYWLYSKANFKILNYSSTIVWLAMLISLLIDANNVYNNLTLYVPIIINKGFITFLYCSTATFILALLRQKNVETQKLFLASNYKIAAIILLYLMGAVEISFQFQHNYTQYNFALIYLLLYTTVFILVFIALVKKLQSNILNYGTIIFLYAVNIVLYIAAYSVAYEVQEATLTAQQNNYLYVAHWLNAILIFVMLHKIANHLQSKKQLTEIKPVTFVFITAVLIVLSVEVHLIMNSLFYNNHNLVLLQRVFVKAVLPILWGICSFVMIWVGIKFKFRFIRIYALCILSITLIKLFTYDISNIPVAGKIAAFICLGILLLIVSFMYQRLKKIISNDEEKISD